MSAFEVVAWLGNACFFSRFFVQWLASERAGECVAPRPFWWLSLGGSLALGTYVASIGELVLLPGYVLTFCLYLRNIWIQGRRERAATLGPRIVLGLGITAALTLLLVQALAPRHDGVRGIWLVLGFVGQILFATRFVLQWMASERHGRSHFPVSFWWASLAGNACMLAYASHLGDAAILAGYLPGPIVQIRNLVLARRGARVAAEARPAEA